MTNIKKYFFRLAYTFLALFLSLLFITTLYYFNLINESFYKVFKIIILIVNIFVSGYILGKCAKSKGYLEGIKLSMMVVPLFLVGTFLLREPLKLTIIIYYLIITITATLSSMIGMLRKKETNS